MNKKIIVFALLFVVVAAIAAGFYLDRNRNESKVSTPEVEKEEFSIKDNEVEGSLPKAFPEDLLLEPGSDLIEVRESQTNDGRIQSQVTTTTKKTLVKAVSDYVDFFKTKNWVEIESIYKETPEKVTAVMHYKNDRLTIVSQVNSENGEKIVEIDLLQVSLTK